MSVYIYILVMAVTTYLIRMIPLALFRKKITNRFVNSFLCYVPCACLTAMTFPSMLGATSSLISAACGLGAALFLAYKEKSLVVVAACSCATVFVVEQIISLV